MKWYCKFCKMFIEVDKDNVCNNCQFRKKIFKYVPDPTEKESVVEDNISEVER